MKYTPPFVPSDIADRVISGDDPIARARGASIVALQIHNSTIFSRWLWLTVMVVIAATISFHSWLPVIFGVIYQAFEYFDKIYLMSRVVARAGVLVEYQAAYKRLYYRDSEFKKQVDEMVLAKEFFKVEL